MYRSKVIKVLSLIFFGCWCISHAFAQTDTVKTDTPSEPDYYEMSLEKLDSIKASGVSTELEKLLNELIVIASKKSMSARESPAIITLVTAEEIRKSGARDLIDVFRLVPGFDFAIEGESVIGLGIRGNWAQEGKVLMMIDGQEINDIYTSRLQFGNHYPIDNIQRIEIIRGPGSAVYGGSAAFGVINIITKSADDLNGISVALRGGQMANTYGRRLVNIGAGKTFTGKKPRNVFSFSFNTFFGTGQRSDQPRSTYITPVDARTAVFNNLSMAGKSATNPFQTNLNLSYRKYNMRLILDRYAYTLTEYTRREAPMSRHLSNALNYIYLDLKRTFQVGKKLTLTPRLNQVAQIYESKDAFLGMRHLGAAVNRTRLNLTANYNMMRRVNLVAGVEYFLDEAISDSSSRFSNGDTVVMYNNYAAFGQLTAQSRLVNVIFGARYDKHNRYGSAFVPRLALTKRLGRFHFKALYSQAFRAPTIGNIENASGDYHIDYTGKIHMLSYERLQPERTRVIEVELGHQVSRDILVSINIFDISIKHPIVYYSQDLGVNFFKNFDETGTRGAEMEVKVKKHWGFINANYSFYTVAQYNRLAVYTTRDIMTESFASVYYTNSIELLERYREVNKGVLLAFPSHKFTVNSSIELFKGFSVNPSLVVYSKRYGYDVYDPYNVGAGGIHLKAFPTTALANLFINYDNCLLKGLNLGVGCYDLFNQKFQFLQPYFGLTPPMPGPSREIVFRAAYDLKFQKNKK